MAASANLLNHRGPAKVFDSLEECQKYLLNENSDITPDTVIVLRGYGPKGAPGMPENGNFMPLPPKFNKMGINDFVRITDARMSGGCFGTQVLHVAPESAIGGPLAAVMDGDIIHLDQTEVVDGKRTQRIDIHYRCIGAITIPEDVPIPDAELSLETRQGVEIAYSSTPVA